MSWTLELFCKLGFAWNSLVMRLSSSFELDAWAKVSPVRTVSTTSGSDVETPFTVEPATFPVCVWRRTKVKLKMSSSSFDRRSKNVGTGALGGASGSWNGVIDGPQDSPLCSAPLEYPKGPFLESIPEYIRSESRHRIPSSQ